MFLVVNDALTVLEVTLFLNCKVVFLGFNTIAIKRYVMSFNGITLKGVTPLICSS